MKESGFKDAAALPPKLGHYNRGRPRQFWRLEEREYNGWMFRYEHRSQPLLPRKLFFVRIGRHALLALGVMALFLLLGTLGYHSLAGLPMLDALLNASMILSGMGPVDAITSHAGKLFATAYALVSGLVFAFTTGIIISPMLHRVFHSLHIEDSE